MNKSMKIKLSLIIYSFIMTYLHSFNSIRFDDSSIYSDNAVFYLMGRGILKGQVLYKDMYDHKTPYIYLLNSIAAIFDKNHIGLYIITSIVLFFSLFYAYKILMLFIDNTIISLTGVALICLFFNNANLTLGFLRTEGYAVALILPSAYLFLKFFLEDKKDFKLLNMFIIGVLAGFTLFINIKSSILYAPFAISTCYILIKNNNIKNIFLCFITGLLGIIISSIPNFVYLIKNNCFYEAVDAIFRINSIYAKTYTSINANNENLFEIILRVITVHPIITMIIITQLICIITYKTKNCIKIPTLSSFIICVFYTVIVNRPYTYYYTILIPFLIPTFLVLVDLFKNVKLKTNAVLILLISIMFILNFPLGYFTVNKRYFKNYQANKYLHEMLKDEIEINENTKVLSYGYSPEYYMYLNKNISFKYFIIPNIKFKYFNTAYKNQIDYIKYALPDVLIFTFDDYIDELPSSYYKELHEAINYNYRYIGEIKIFDNSLNNPNVLVRR